MKYVPNLVAIEAFKIERVSGYSGDGSLQLRLENGEIRTATKEMTARYVPSSGDYYVVQPDGYVYLNPKEVFERKYRKAEE